MELLILAFLLSIDNVRLAAGLGLLESSAERWWRLALVMAVVEATFPLLGAAVAPVWLDGVASFQELGPVLLIVAAALTFAGLTSKRTAGIGWMLYALPVLFGLDNLVAGAALGLPGMGALPAALLVGAISGAVSLATMAVVGRCAEPLRARWAAAPAAIAAVVGLSFFVAA